MINKKITVLIILGLVIGQFTVIVQEIVNETNQSENLQNTTTEDTP